MRRPQALSTRKTALLGFALLVASPASAQNWIRSGTFDSSSVKLAPRSDGRFYDVTVDAYVERSFVRIRGHEGDTLVARELIPVVGGKTSALWADVLPDDDLVVSGASWDDDYVTGRRTWLARLDSESLVPVWSIELEDTVASAARVFADGTSIYTLGLEEGASNFVVTRCDHDGHVQWKSAYTLTSSPTYVIEATSAPGGGVTAVCSDQYGNAHVIAVGADGEVAWHNTYDLVTLRGATLGEDGNLYVSGFDQDDHLVVASFLPGGQLRWSKRFVTFAGSPSRCTPGPGDGVLVCGSREIGDDDHSAILALDGDGEIRFHRTYDFSESTYETLTDVARNGPRGWVARILDGLDHYSMSISIDGAVDPSCMSTIDLVASVSAANLGADEPPDVERDAYAIGSSLLLLQPIPVDQPTPLVCGDPCSAVGSTSGLGTAGSGGIVPVLDATTGACLGAPHPRIELTRGLGGAPGVLAYSLGTSTIPLFDGQFYLDPLAFWVLPIALDGAPGVPDAGSWTAVIDTDFEHVQGVTISTQAFVLDPGSAFGIACTRAAHLTIE